MVVLPSCPAAACEVQCRRHELWRAFRDLSPTSGLLFSPPSFLIAGRFDGVVFSWRTKSEYRRLLPWSCDSFPYQPTVKMEEGRKRVLAIVAGILVARHLKNTEDLHDSRPSPRTESLIGSAVQWADRIMRRIDGAFSDSNSDRPRS
jgi:hypothetical protein